MTNKYEFGEIRAAPGCPLTDRKAQLYSEFMDKLRKELGRDITPIDLLNAARDTDHEIKNAFDWNDASAAHTQRLNMAGQLIRWVHIEVIKEDEVCTVRKYHPVVEREGHNGYLGLPEISKSKNYRKMLVDRAYKELQGWRKRHKQYKEFDNVFSAIDDLDL